MICLFFNSSAIKRAEYDAPSMRLKLWFSRRWPLRLFAGSPQHIWDGLLSARSKGTYYNDHIRDRYQC
ncbi:KTSC domain-containing protein [Novosphingobium colocasiae]